MGRTVIPYSMQIDMIRNRFRNFRRALRAEDRELFDEIFRSAKRNVQAGVMAANPNPFDSVLLSAMIEQQRILRNLQQQIDDIRAGSTKAYRTPDESRINHDFAER